LGGHDRHKGAAILARAEFHNAFHLRENGVILADADIAAGVPLRAALADDDVARNDGFATELLHAEATACAVATVAGRTACLFVSHVSTPSGRLAGNVEDLDEHQILAMAVLAAIVLATALLEDRELRAAGEVHDLGLDLGAIDERRADLGLAFAAEHQHFAELDLVAGLRIEALDLEEIVFRDPVLLAAGPDDGEHR